MIFGIGGATGAGKTTFLRKLIEGLGPDQLYVSCIHHDSYYKNEEDIPADLRGSKNFDHPDALDNDLFISHLEALRKGKPIEGPVYDFAARRRRPETCLVEPKPVILVEGILIFAIPEVCRLLDIKVFIDTAADLRIIRRLERDLAERGRTVQSVITQYRDTVRPLHSQFVEPSREHVDLIINGAAHSPVAVDLLVTKINAVIAATLGRQGNSA